MPVLVGTSGWNYPTGRGTWNGVFYPAPRPRGFDELGYYAEHFDTVEINSTFYRMPEAPMAARWLERTPPEFVFSVKLFQKFTHPDMYLARPHVTDWDLSRADIDLFRAGVDPIALAGRLGAVLMQFPPSFHRTAESQSYLDWLLGALGDLPIAVELRHRTWSDAETETTACLDAHGASWVLIDEPKFADSIRQETRAVVGTATPRSPLYVRLHGRNAANWWDHAAAEDRYDYLYARDELEPFAARARRDASTGRKVLIYFNNHFSAKAVANAAVLKHDLGQPVPGDYPRAMVSRYPDLDHIVEASGLPI